MGDRINSHMPEIQVKLDTFVRQIAEAAGSEAARVVLNEHVSSCQAPKLLVQLDGRIKDLEDCKNNVKGLFGYLTKNWQMAVVVVLLAVSYFNGGGNITPEEIKQIALQVQTIKQVLPPVDIGAAPKKPGGETSKDKEIN